MWRSDRAITGPHAAAASDIDALNRVFSDAFTERYRRDGLSGVRVPYLNPEVWQFAIADAGDGAMVWRDARGELIAFNMVHRSGSEGWMGPLAVRPDRQGQGMGRRIVEAGIAWLRSHAVGTIGLETMPRTIENIGFYSRLGFVPGYLTITLQRELATASARSETLGAAPDGERDALLQRCHALATTVAPGIDFRREIELTLEHRLGDVSLYRDGSGALRGFALWHDAPLAQGRNREELRVLKLVACDLTDARAVVAAVEGAAAGGGLRRVSVRCQSCETELYRGLIADGFRVQWTDLRMTLAGAAEAPRHGIVLSNWEI